MFPVLQKNRQVTFCLAICLFAILLVSCFAHLAVAGTRTIAILPVEDLSKGINSPNLELTNYLAEALSLKGMNVVAENDVIAFMAAERVRWLGYLETEQILKAQTALGADLILLGTICQRREKNSPTFGLSLQLIRTLDAKTIWSSSGGLSLADMQRLLGLNQPATLDELWPLLVRDVLSRWPSDLEERLGQQLVFDIESGELPPTLQIKGINLSPRYVRPGEQVKCAVQLEQNENAQENPQVFIKVGSRIHLAQQSTEGLFYEASWTGSEIEKGIFREVGNEALKLASTDLSPQYFEGIWPTLDEDDTYPVTLILSWSSGERQIAYVGNYSVDSAAPEIELFIKGQVLNDIITFNDKILILPKMKEREPTSHWKIHVENDMGFVLIGDEGDGNLPNNFFWNGNRYDGHPVEDGIYRMVLKVWDRAGNADETFQDVKYIANPPDMLLNVEKADQYLRLSVDRDNKEIPLAYWYIEVWNSKGDLIKASDGTELPFVYDIPISGEQRADQIDGIVAMKDILGNQTRVEISDLYLMALQKENSDDQETTDSDEFRDDSWSWVPNF